MGKRTIIAVILAVIGIAAIATGAYQIWKIHLEDLKAETKYAEMSVTYGDGTSSDGIYQKLAALNAKNPDCIYWLKIPDTKIDYPVMYHPQEEEYYLYRDFDKEYSPAGSLYLAENCDPVHGDNLIIYGHHMRSGAMFAQLEDYKNEDSTRSSQPSQRRYIQIMTLNTTSSQLLRIRLSSITTSVSARKSRSMKLERLRSTVRGF